MNKAWIRILLVVLCVGSVFSQTCLFSDNTTPAGKTVNGLCSCYSGYFGANGYQDCTQKADASCSFNAAPQNLQTAYIPSLDESASNVNNGIVKLVIRSPLVDKRMDAAISFQNGDASCSYPGNLWVKSIETCNDTFTISMPLSEAQRCGWTTDNTDQTYSYLRSILVVSQYDNLSLRNDPIVRTTQSIIRVEIRFPKKITVTSEIRVFSSVNLLAAITFQAYDPVTGTATIEYTTSLQYPFKLTDVLNLIVPSPLVSNSSLTDINCPNTQGAACTQKIRLVIIPGSACKLNGNYNITTAVACRGDQALCPLDANTNTALIGSKVVSEDFCQVVRFDIDLSGSLVVYQDAAYTVPKSAFLPTQRAYFLAVVWSSKATIIKSTITDIAYTVPGQSTRSLLVSGVPTALANLNSFALAGKNATSEGFNFAVSVGQTDSDMFPVNVDANAQFLFSATVAVEWQGLNPLSNGKRFVFDLAQSNALPSGTQDKKFATQMNITPLNNVGQTPTASVPLSNLAFSSASTVVASLASAAVALLALF